MILINGYLKAGSVLLISLFLLLGCGSKAVENTAEFVKIAGPTMGTDYHITAQLPTSVDQVAVASAISARLVKINQSMSTYIADSEISQFNHASVNEWTQVSDDFLQVLLISQQVYEQSQGAFNPTIGPLVDLWGFGPGLSVEQFQHKPDDADINDKRQQLDFRALTLTGQKLQKNKPMRLDFSAVAKGYAVDEIARLLTEVGALHYMVEIGGEVRTQGLSPRNTVWRIGIEQPGNLRGKTFKALTLSNASVATSGDYRNYLEIDGQRYSHTIDPTSGYPVDHRLSSVTVISDNAAAADAWATALMVLGQEQGFILAKQYKLAVYMIYRDGDQMAVKFTESIKPYLAD